MIVSASYRTDIPAFYGRWFMNRLDAGRCAVPNPYGGRPYDVSLRAEDVHGFVFWTKSAGPFAGPLAEVGRRGYPFVVQYTITGYPAALERSVPDAAQSAALFRSLAEAHGARALVWRYDPIVTTDLTPPGWHEANFARLAAALRGATDEVVISFAQIYRKTRRNLAAAARAHGFGWRDPEPDEKRDLAQKLAAIAADSGMRLTVCTQPEFAAEGTEPARCIDAARLSDVAGRPITAPTRGNRPGCLCARSRDIGAYDTCPMGCVYCYAVSSREKAVRNHAAHDPAGPALAGGAGLLEG